MAYNKCPVCRMPAHKSSTDPLAVDHDINCYRCGPFHTIGDSAWVLAESALKPQQRATISSYIRRNAGLTISREKVDSLSEFEIPSVAAKADRFLILLSKRHPIPGEEILSPFAAMVRIETIVRDQIDSETDENQFSEDDLKALEYMGQAGLVDSSELRWLIYNCLVPLGFLSVGNANGFFQITSQGWKEIARIQEFRAESRIGFVAMPFNKLFDPLFDHGLEPGIRTAGYEPLRIDRIEHNHRIDDEIVSRIKQSRFLVADFSLNKGGIYFEAGFAMGLGLPVIWVVREDRLKSVHFDTRQFNHITWKPDELPLLVKALRLRIEATIGRGPSPLAHSTLSTHA